MKNFNYSYPTEIVFGLQTILQLPILLKKYNSKKILMVYGKKSIKQNGIYNTLIGTFKKLQIGYIEYSNCESNPDCTYVNSGAKIAIENNVNFILAVGGGSVIDASKAIALLVNNDNSEGIWPYMKSEKNFANEGLPIGVILTTVGTGSEGNGSFIISNNSEMEKLGRSHLSIRPAFAICDPAYTVSVGKWQTACGCFDIVSHLLEQYFCAEDGTDLSDSLIIASLKTTISHSKILTNEPENIESRGTIMLASTFALSYILSLGKTLDWSVHKIEHALTGVYGVTHGAGLACIFPAWMQLASKNKKVADKIIRLNHELGINCKSNDRTEIIRNTIIYFKDFVKSLGLTVSLTQLLSDRPDVDRIAARALRNGDIGSIFTIDLKTCRELLTLAK